MLKKYFSYNLNATQQKLDEYYIRIDTMLVYYIAIFLYPTLKQRQFERYQETKPDQIAIARKVIDDLQSNYKYTPTNVLTTNATIAILVDKDNEQANDDTTIAN